MCSLDQSGSWREPIISARAITLFADRAANDRRDLGREQLDHAGNVCKRQAADVDLRKETLMAEQLALIEDLVDDLLRATDENRAMRGGTFVIIGPRDLLRAILRRRVVKEIAGIVRIKCVQGVLRIVSDVHVGGDADLERTRVMPGLHSGLPVEIGERRQLCRRHADIGERQWQTKRAGAHDAVLRAAGADPDGQATLRRPRWNWRILQGRAEASLPSDALGGIELHEQFELFREQIVGVGKFVAEQRKRFGEYASSGNDLGASAAHKVDGRKVLEDQDWIRRAQDGNRASQADALGHRRDRRQYYRRGRDRHIQPMMFANCENVEARRICKLRCREDLRQALLGADRIARLRFRHEVAERIEPQLECPIHRIAAYLLSITRTGWPAPR